MSQISTNMVPIDKNGAHQVVAPEVIIDDKKKQEEPKELDEPQYPIDLSSSIMERSKSSTANCSHNQYKSNTSISWLTNKNIMYARNKDKNQPETSSKLYLKYGQHRHNLLFNNQNNPTPSISSQDNQQQRPKSTSKNSPTNTTNNNKNNTHNNNTTNNTNDTTDTNNHTNPNTNHKTNDHHRDGNTNGSNVNSTLIGNYELKVTLGKGNFSTVKLAQHRITKHFVAIKVVKISTLSDENLSKINREIEVLKKIGKHDHIVRLYQVIKTRRYYMLVTEFCKDGELFDLIVTHGKLTEQLSYKYFIQILSALEFLHDQNIVHRDLKTENLLLTDNYETIKIVDFGFANYYKPDDPLATWCGSPPYAAPELFKGRPYVGPPVDIWSLGVILYVLVTGSLPFDGANLIILKSRILTGKFRTPYFVTSDCDSLLRGLLTVNPRKRFTIRRIRSHDWILNRGCRKRSTTRVPGPGAENIPSQQASQENNRTSSNNNSGNNFVKTNQNQQQNHQHKQSLSSKASSKPVESTSDKNNCNSTTNRGQSLDLDDGKKLPESNDLEDTSMASLTISNDRQVRDYIIQRDRKSKSTREQHFVETEMAMAVSNMSLDSNVNSSMSVCPSVESYNPSTSTICTSSRAESSQHSTARNLSKESSIDDQIIDFMVDNLKVAENPSSIRRSLANDRYDDLQAMYKLIKDQPEIMGGANVTVDRFQIPSLPIISYKDQKVSRKPSITTGFVNLPKQFSETTDNKNAISTTNNNSNIDDVNINDKPRGSRDSGVVKDIEQSQPIPMEISPSPINPISALTATTTSTVTISATISTSATFTIPNAATFITSTTPLSTTSNIHPQQYRHSDDYTWKEPPQLFLTPPADSKQRTDASMCQDHSMATDDTTNKNNTQYNALARHSFDSRMQQILNKPGEITACAQNQLTIQGYPLDCSWDSTILDQLGLLTPSHRNQSRASPLSATLNETLTFETSNQINNNKNNETTENLNQPSIHKNMAQITTNLQEIGRNSRNNLTNQNLLLSHLSTLTANTSMAHSSVLSQSNTEGLQTAPPIRVTPNNLINQNPLSDCTPNLLDPNYLNSGLERRASDGQASYSSLTTNNIPMVPSTSSLSNDNTMNIDSNQQMLDQPAQIYRLSQEILRTANDMNIDREEELVDVKPFISCDQSLEQINNNNIPLKIFNEIKYSLMLSFGAANNPQIPMPIIDNNQEQRPLDLTTNPIPGFSDLSLPPLDFSNSQPGDRSPTMLSPSINLDQSTSSASTSPRNSSFMSNINYNNSLHPSYPQSCQTSPLSFGFAARGGVSHLASRRKRHSLETEVRAHFCPNHHNHYLNSHNLISPYANKHRYSPNIQNNTNINSINHNVNNQYNEWLYKNQFLINPHIAQIRNLKKSFTKNNSNSNNFNYIDKQEPPSNDNR